MKNLIDIFVAFAKVGVLTFGGGYAMLPIIEKEIVESKSWISNEEVMDYYAVGQCLPGAIAVNTAVFIGHKLRGRSGAVAAALGVVTPSLIIICIIAGILTNFSDVPLVQSAFAGVRVCVCVLILNSVIKLWKNAVKDKTALLLCLVVFALSAFVDVSPVVLVLSCAAAGIILTVSGGRGK